MAATQGEARHVELLEARVALLEQQVQTLTVAVDAASRLRLSSIADNPDVRVAGGKRVRRILEKGGLISGYREFSRAE
jgi:hypothetical protein